MIEVPAVPPPEEEGGPGALETEAEEDLEGPILKMVNPAPLNMEALEVLATGKKLVSQLGAIKGTVKALGNGDIKPASTILLKNLGDYHGL